MTSISSRAAAMVSAAALLLLVTACSATPSANSSGGASGSSSMLSFAQCMRSHGVSGYPDPDSSGSIPKKSASQLGVTAGQLQSAQSACQQLLPNGGNGPNQAQLQQEKALGLSFAKCMRAHGVALPDPDNSGRIPDPATVGIDQGSPQFQAANQACRKYRPAYMPSNAAYNAWARTNG
ncbi:MAG TPA: hypothetical protein VHZ98_17315 [Galbitalea sp.]|jgi:hypothetical protein|nr:hypothetical protein [Galbitalea sp.]